MFTKGKWKVKTISSERELHNGNTVRDEYNVPICYGARKDNAYLIATAPDLLAELGEAHLIINRLVEQIHINHTKDNNIVEKIKWPTIREVERKEVIAKATNN